MLSNQHNKDQDILNADLDITKPHKNNSGQTEADVLAACEGEIKRTLLEKGTVLYKFSTYSGLSPTRDNLSEWWFTSQDMMSMLRYIEGSVINKTANQDVLSLEEKGESFDPARLAEHVTKQDMRYIVRHAAAIRPDWNSLGFLLAIQLKEDVYGFQSLIKEQPKKSPESGEPQSVRFEAPASIEEPAAQDVLSGGLRQMYIPFMTRDKHAIASQEFNGSCSIKMEDLHNHLIWLNTQLGQQALMGQIAMRRTAGEGILDEAQRASAERLSRMEADKKSMLGILDKKPTSEHSFFKDKEHKHHIKISDLPAKKAKNDSIYSEPDSPSAPNNKQERKQLKNG